MGHLVRLYRRDCDSPQALDDFAHLERCQGASVAIFFFTHSRPTPASSLFTPTFEEVRKAKGREILRIAERVREVPCRNPWRERAEKAVAETGVRYRARNHRR